MSKLSFIKNAIILLFLITVAGLGIRGLITGDSRWGWGMFREQVEYEIKYVLVREGGRIEGYLPGSEVRGARAVEWLMHKNDTRYGYAAVRSWLSAYLQELPEFLSNSGDIIEIRAFLDYKINGDVNKSGIDSLCVTVK